MQSVSQRVANRFYRSCLQTLNCDLITCGNIEIQSLIRSFIDMLFWETGKFSSVYL